MTTCTPAVDKALIVFDVLRSAEGAVRLSDLSRRTGLPKSSVHRLLSALMKSGLVTRLGAGYAATDLAPAAEDSGRALRRLAPFVADVVMRTRSTASLAVLDGDDVVFSHRVHGHWDVRMPSDDQGRAPARQTAAGRVLLALDPRSTDRELVRIRDRGFATVERDGVTCVAVAVPLRGQRVALTVRARTELVELDRMVFWLRTVAQGAVENGAHFIARNA
ncbi:IclR family transcriptional regulator [Kutzneria sp. NPDC052558]|uniref:IclR family transcriptional regulator n=1 Tax=Kutzneria sp. NPDC052558 TaxID=3364121 RepID=UPI0037CB56EB